VKTYLRKLILNYQQAACDNLTDADNSTNCCQLAGSSRTARRRTGYQALQPRRRAQGYDHRVVITELKAGGDKAKVTWLASCGLEFPDVPGKLIEVTPGSDTTQLKVAFVTSDAEFDAQTTPDMDVKVAGQPEAAKLEKDNPVRFTGTLLAYDPDPSFMLHWTKPR